MAALPETKGEKTMLIPVLLFIVGLLCLIKGGDWFVDGATGIARRFHVPELLIGATVVSIGTTLPEVMVSTTSAFTGHGEIAYGNAIGSIICNASLIAALTIAVKPGKVDPKSLRTPVLFFFVAAAFYAGVAYTTGYFSRPVGLILLAMFAAYIICNVMAMKNAPAPEEEEEPEEQTIFEVVENMPDFPGGQAALMQYLAKNIKYPTIAQENGTQGRVIVQFVVNRDGSIVDAKVVRSVDPYLDKEALRVINTMPKWKPGMQRGKPVRVKFTVPVMFRLQ